MFESKINRGRANGYAPLDSGSKVPLSYLPPIQSTIDTGSFATTSSLQSLIDTTGSFLTSLSGAISSSEQVLGGSGIYSSSAQIQGNIYSAGNSFTIQDLVIGAGTTQGKILTDGGKPIQMVPDGTTQTTQFWPNGNVTIQTGGTFVDNGYRLEVSGSTKIVGTLDVTGGITGSTNFDTIVNKPTLISGSQQIKDLGFVTGSYTTINAFNNLTQSFNIISGSVVNIQGGFDTASYQTFTSSVNNSVTSLNSYTSSLNNAFQLTGSNVSFLGNIVVYGTQSIINSQNVEISDNILYLSPTTSIDNDLGVVGHYNDGTYRHAGIFMDASDGHSWKVFKGLQTETTATVDTSGTGFTLADFKAGAFTGTSFNGQINSTNGVISGSSQLTSSFDTRYATSASYLTSLNGAISSSSQLTSSYDTRYTLSGSVVNSNINTGSFATTGSNSFNGNQTITGSLVVSSVAVVSGGLTIPTGSVITLTTGSSIFVDSSGAITGSLTGSVFGIGDVTAFSSSVNSRINSITSSAIPVGTISGSSQLTSSFDTRYTLSGSVQPLPNGLISGSSQLTSSYDTRYAPSASYLTSLNGAISSSTQILGGSGIYSSSAQLPSGIISGSSQLTASYDTRYTLSGSVVSGTTPAGTISGSSQLTSSFDGRYTQTGSFNTLTASFNSFTASAQSVTTGSNSFNGTQTITGSLIITTGSFFASQILANTASLYLTSGSNMYVQNNGVVEITGSLIVSGSTMFTSAGGDEGGEIQFGIPTTNTTLQNRVTTDVWQNRYRIFEGSANAKGVFVDLSKAPAGVGGELTWKASGLVNTGVDVILGDLKARIPSTGNKSLQLSSTTGVTYSVYGSGVYSQGSSIAGTTINASSPLSISSTPTYLASGYNFGTAGATDTWVIMDTSNTIAWRITMILGSGFNNNLITIERLH